MDIHTVYAIKIIKKNVTSIIFFISLPTVFLHHAETMYSIYIVIYLCIIVNNYDSSKEFVIGEFVDVVSRCVNLIFSFDNSNSLLMRYLRN